MTRNSEVVRTFIDKAWANPPESVVEVSMAYLADDFHNLDPDGNVLMNKEAYIGFGQLLLTAFKDLRIAIKEIRDQGDEVMFTGHWEGTHTGDLDLSAMGLGVYPASGKWIEWPDGSSKWKVAGDKIASIQTLSGDIQSFLAALGVSEQSR